MTGTGSPHQRALQSSSRILTDKEREVLKLIDELQQSREVSDIRKKQIKEHPLQNIHDYRMESMVE